MHETIFALKRAYQATRHTIDEGLHPYQLTWAQLDILLLLYKQEVQEQRELQLAMGITSATLTRTVNGLVKRGYVERILSQEDARVKQLRLTEKATVLLTNLQEEEDRLLRHTFFQGFTSSEIALLTEWLNRIARNMGDTSDSKF